MTSESPIPTVCLELGNNYSKAAIVEQGTTGQAIRFDDQVQLPSAVLQDGDKTYVGSKAFDLAYRTPNGFYTDCKRLVPVTPGEPMRDGGLTPVDWLCLIFAALLQAVVRSSEPIARAIKAGRYHLVVPHPSMFGEREKKAFCEALQRIGLVAHSFISEAQAAAWHIRSLYPGRICHGDIVACIDVGSSTTDIEFLVYSEGGFSQVAPGTGVATGGVDFTVDLCHHYCEELGLAHLKSCFVAGTGFSFNNPDLSQDSKRDALKLYRAAESIKREFCNTRDAVESIVELSSGMVELSCDEETVMSLWGQRIAQIVDCFSASFDALESDQRPTWLCCFGGGIVIPDLIPRLSLSACIDEEHTLIARESATAIARGAVEAAASGFAGVSVVNRGIGVRVKDKDTGKVYARLLVKEGTTVAPSGIYIETDSLFIEPSNGRASLVLEVCEIQPDSEVHVVAGQEVVEIAHTSQLGVCRFYFSDLEDVPHQVSLQFEYKDRIPSLSVRLIDTEQELQHASLLDDSAPEAHSEQRTHLVLVCDVSASMKDDLATVKQAIKKHVPALIENGVEVSLIEFGTDTKVVLSQSNDTHAVCSAADAMELTGTTDMAGGIAAASELVDPQCQDIVFLYSDGFPDSAPDVIKAADTLRKRADQVVTFGIGSGAKHDLMRDSIASTQDHHFKGTPEEIPLVFDTVVDLYLLPSHALETEMSL